MVQRCASALGLLLAVLAGTACLGSQGDGQPCLHVESVISVGETRWLQVFRRVGSDCRGDLDRPSGFTWQSSDPTVKVSRYGEIRGLAPGPFSVTATGGSTSMKGAGLVLPMGWRLAIEPAQATVAVGAKIAFTVRVLGPDGQLLKDVPCSLGQSWDEGEGRQDVLTFPGGTATFGQTTPIEVVAAKPGRAIVIGYLGRYQVRAPVTVSAN
jgi:hypothetical protein